MNHIKKVIIPYFILITLLLAGSIVYAQTGGNYDLSRHTTDSGSDTLTGGTYTLVGSSGQPEVGLSMTGSDYSLTGGFWASTSQGASNSGQSVYLPLILHQ